MLRTQLVDKLRQRAELHHRSLRDELLAVIETAVVDDRRNATTPGFAEQDQSGFQTPREAIAFEEVLEQVRALPDERQQEVAQILLAYLDAQEAEVALSPEQIEEIERRMADDGPYATEEEVREVLARLTK